MFNFFVKLYKSYQYLSNSDITLSNEYSRGVHDTTESFKKAQRKSNDVISDLITEGEDRQSDMRKTYKDRIDDVEKAWNTRCRLCKQYTENERRRLRGMQAYISKFISDFTAVYSSLLSNVSFVQDANEKILNGAALMKDSKERLERLKKAADKAIAGAETVMQLTEEDINVKKGAGGDMQGDKLGVKGPNADSGEDTGEILPEDIRPAEQH